MTGTLSTAESSQSSQTSGGEGGEDTAAMGLFSGRRADIVRIVANIFISFIGAGVLGLPYAFKESGLVEGAIVMSVVCYLSVKAMLLLIDCKYKVEPMLAKTSADESPKTKMSNGKQYAKLDNMDEESRAGDEVSHRVAAPQRPAKKVTYSDLGRIAFGPPGQLLVDTVLLISQVGFCCAYLIFISENLATFIHGLNQHQWLIIIMPPLFLLTLIPDLSKLAMFSILAQISNLLAFVVVFWFDFDHLHLASNEHRKEFSIKGFPFFFSVAIYCYEGAGMILSLEHSAKEYLRPSFKRLFVITIVAVTVLYITFGVSGYLSYGADTKDIITLNLPHNAGLDFALLVKACLCFSLFFTYPIMLFPVTSLLDDRVLKQAGGMSPALMRLGLVAATGVVVMIIPRFADLMALVGATCCTLLAFILPGTFHSIIFGKLLTRNELMLDYALVATGVIAAILGTYDAISNILQNN